MSRERNRVVSIGWGWKTKLTFSAKTKQTHLLIRITHQRRSSFPQPTITRYFIFPLNVLRKRHDRWMMIHTRSVFLRFISINLNFFAWIIFRPLVVFICGGYMRFVCDNEFFYVRTGWMRIYSKAVQHSMKIAQIARAFVHPDQFIVEYLFCVWVCVSGYVLASAPIPIHWTLK